jgi:hypothetical protein
MAEEIKKIAREKEEKTWFVQIHARFFTSRV